MATKKKAKKKVSPKVAPVAKKRGAVAHSKKTTPRSIARKTTGHSVSGSKGAAGRSPKAAKAPARKTQARKVTSQGAAKSRGLAKKSAPLKSVTRKKTTPQPPPVRRHDRAGHLDPQYAAELRAKSGPREDQGRAFFERTRNPKDDLAEELGEEAVEKATSGGEDVGEETQDEIVPEEQGGPFVETSARSEFALGTDLSNPKGAKREPFPTT